MIYDFEHDDILEIIKKSSDEDLNILCEELREFLLSKVSKTGGHLASNLGAVELTVALHRVYDSPKDRIIFDVGHQSYIHKIITGRGAKFDRLRKYGGLSGFPKSRESEHDAYDTGHSSTSLGAAEGMAEARDIKGEDYEVIAVIGDGSMTGGLAYEALNNIGSSGSRVRMVLNDNGMSIARNVGAMSRHLYKLRTSDEYMKAKDSIKMTVSNIPVIGRTLSGNMVRTRDKIKFSLMNGEGILFEELGIKYIGPIDGHDVQAMTEAFEAANSIDAPTIVHVITRKGKGYSWAEKYPKKFHGVGPFEISDGKMLSSSSSASFSKIFGDKISDIADKDDRIVAISAAMGTATGLGSFYVNHRERYFDVGIAEAHAVVFAAGMAKAGMIPIVAIYSSFLQRAFDEIIEDVALQDLHVIFAIDRAGLVGADGETHHGQFDLSYLSMIPNMTVLCPADGHQLEEMLDYAVKAEGPVAIRYPRGSAEGGHLRLKPFEGNNIVLSSGKDATILAVGAMLDEALKAAEILRAKGYDVGVSNICRIKPETAEWHDLDTKVVATLEDNAFKGGFGETFAASHRNCGYEILAFALPDRFVGQGSIGELRLECGIDAISVADGVERLIEKASRCNHR